MANGFGCLGFVAVVFRRYQEGTLVRLLIESLFPSESSCAVSVILALTSVLFLRANARAVGEGLLTPFEATSSFRSHIDTQKMMGSETDLGQSAKKIHPLDS